MMMRYPKLKMKNKIMDPRSKWAVSVKRKRARKDLLLIRALQAVTITPNRSRDSTQLRITIPAVDSVKRMWSS